MRWRSWVVAIVTAAGLGLLGSGIATAQNMSGKYIGGELNELADAPIDVLLDKIESTTRSATEVE
ncbi:hypothetical protein A8924_5346 [Saccharopolyspora erythraea NRRL 2338]|uniref:Secreted protein n=1 Tax=Saccharopolyspora erythraea TaxID=1836 RepID=A0ABN1EAC0_SACER|nr:hypothetical protein [Saccharopolyspora erythraea]PFG97879.1 hypothetical protein A8924_5346 [Saccharopolyspora erythraea NRRL 2338]QRK88014.1 hypothetical protein JQX30_25190 [Saccharopolyspora erythraea]